MVQESQCALMDVCIHPLLLYLFEVVSFEVVKAWVEFSRKVSLQGLPALIFVARHFQSLLRMHLKVY